MGYLKLEPYEEVKLKDVLATAFNLEDLEDLVSRSLNIRLEHIAGEGNVRSKVYVVVKWANDNNKISELIEEAVKQRPDNFDLQKIVGEIKRRSTSPAGGFYHTASVQGQMQLPLRQKSYSLIESYNFDMHHIKEFYVHELQKSGLMGVGLSCDLDEDSFIFLQNFGKRMIYDLRDRLNYNFRVPEVVCLKPTLNSANSVINFIKRQEKNLEIQDVLCRVYVEGHDQDPIPDFWGEVLRVFNTPYPHRLIILIAGSKNTQFPEGIFRVSAPAFKKQDAESWVYDICSNYGWSLEVIRKWAKMMIDRCCYEDPLLRTSLVYEHIEEVKELLQREELTEEDFLSELERLYC